MRQRICLFGVSNLLGASAHSSATFFVIMTILDGIATLYFGWTWYRVNTGIRKPRKSYLQYLTTRKYRRIWEMEKTFPSYYVVRFWGAVTIGLVAFIKATHPNLR